VTIITLVKQNERAQETLAFQMLVANQIRVKVTTQTRGRA
jgi:hypothetical protein